jgi:hypothetical protein
VRVLADVDEAERDAAGEAAARGELRVVRGRITGP